MYTFTGEANEKKKREEEFTMLDAIELLLNV